MDEYMKLAYLCLLVAAALCACAFGRRNGTQYIGEAGLVFAFLYIVVRTTGG